MSPARRRKLRKRHHRTKLIILIGALVALGACERRTTFFATMESPGQAQVSWVEFNHTARFAGRDTVLAASEKAHLQTFVRRLARGNGVTISIHAADRVENPVIAARREISVASHLMSLGLHPTLIEGDGGSGGGRGAVIITVGRAIGLSAAKAEKQIASIDTTIMPVRGIGGGPP